MVRLKKSSNLDELPQSGKFIQKYESNELAKYSIN
jgi:hypothetical protein